MKVTQLFRIEEGILKGTEIEIIMGFYAVKYPHKKTKDLYVPPMEVDDKKVTTFHCCQENCKQPDFEGNLEALVEHLKLHSGKLIKHLKPVTAKNPAVIAVKLPPNPINEKDNRGANPDRYFTIKLYMNSLKRSLEKQGIGIIE